MRNRRRRWLRRLAIGISFAVFAVPAAAKPIPAANSTQIVSLRPDDRPDRFTVGQQTQPVSKPVRPDDRGNRFAVSDVASPATSTHTTSVSWDGAVPLGLGALVLVLGLALAIGYVRRPRIAGL